MIKRAEIVIGEVDLSGKTKCGGCGNDTFEWALFLGKKYRVCIVCGKQYEIKGIELEDK